MIYHDELSNMYLGQPKSWPLGRDQGLRPFSVTMIYHNELINMYLGQPNSLTKKLKRPKFYP